MRITTHSVFLFLLAFPSLLAAQVRSSFERMEVEYARGCAPFTVNIDEIDSLGNISRTYTYESGASVTSDTFYTYQNPGRYEVIQLLGEDILPKTDTLVIEVLENFELDFNVSTCDQDRAILSFPSNLYDYYEVGANGTNLLLDSSNKFGDLIDFRDSLQLSAQGFYINAADNCQVIDSLLLRSTNDPIINPSIEFDFVCLNNFTAQVTFSGNEDQLYQLSIISDKGEAFNTITTNWQSGSLVLDSIRISMDNKEICLQIDAISGCDLSVVESKTICQNTEFLNTPVTYAFATYEGDSIRIFIDQENTDNIDLVRIAGENTETVDIQNVNQVSVSSNSDVQPIFEIKYDSECPQDSLVYQIAPPFIQVDKNGINQYLLTTYESKYVFDQSVASSSEYLLTGNNNSVILNTNTAELRLSLENGYSQLLIWSETLDSIQLSSNIEILEYEYYVYVPEGFTPNDDGVNDRLELFGLPTEEFNLKIFNRWGEKVFETSDQDNLWNGRLSNGHIVEGTYVYRLNFYNSLGELFTQQGSFAVIRD